jgi:hypothetical protein
VVLEKLGLRLKSSTNLWSYHLRMGPCLCSLKWRGELICIFACFCEMGRVSKLVFYELERREEGAFVCACILWKYSYRCRSYIEQWINETTTSCEWRLGGW